MHIKLHVFRIKSDLLPKVRFASAKIGRQAISDVGHFIAFIVENEENGSMQRHGFLSYIRRENSSNMNHFSLEGEHVKVDYSNPALPPVARNFMPDVYKDGPEYFCVFGAGCDGVILGTGDTIEQAINAWEEAYHRKLG